MKNYNILMTGSKGNATIIRNKLLIDCGVSFELLKNHYRKLKLILLTHVHSDHFKKTTISKLHKLLPNLRFACGVHLLSELLKIGIPLQKIDILEYDKLYDYKIFKIVAFELFHNVANCGFKVHFSDYKVIYATDTSKIETKANDYDLYLIEANYTIEQLEQRIVLKKLNGEFCYEHDLPDKHLSYEQCFEFIITNKKPNSEYVFMHQNSELLLENFGVKEI